MNILKLIKILKKSAKEKTERQYYNLRQIGELAYDFHNKSETYTEGVRRQIDLLRNDNFQVVIEVAHQPNFLPYSGVWKKAILAGALAEKLNENNINSVALFGFVDQDRSSNPYLYQNRIPYYSKIGYKKIGFNINNTHMLWCDQKLPLKEDIKEHFDEIFKLYESTGMEISTNETSIFKEQLYDSYLGSQNFSDANSKFFSIMCNKVWGINIIFFKYSEVYKKNILNNEFEALLSKRNEYSHIYNKTIIENDLNIRTISNDHVPFWYHCECSRKIRLIFRHHPNISIVGHCPLCGKKYNFDILELDRIMPFISPEAVARDIIFASGLGSDVYVMGHGGSSIYGNISRCMYDIFHINAPFLIQWKSIDKYCRSLLIKPVLDFLKSSKRYNKVEGVLEIDKITEQISYLNIKLLFYKGILKRYPRNSEIFQKALDEIQLLNKKLNIYIKQKQQIDHHEIKRKYLCNAFRSIPSIIDEVISVGSQEVIMAWLNDLINNDFDVEHNIYMPSTFLEKKRLMELDELIDFPMENC